MINYIWLLYINSHINCCYIFLILNTWPTFVCHFWMQEWSGFSLIILFRIAKFCWCQSLSTRHISHCMTVYTAVVNAPTSHTKLAFFKRWYNSTFGRQEFSLHFCLTGDRIPGHSQGLIHLLRYPAVALGCPRISLRSKTEAKLSETF